MDEDVLAMSQAWTSLVEPALAASPRRPVIDRTYFIGRLSALGRIIGEAVSRGLALGDTGALERAAIAAVGHSCAASTLASVAADAGVPPQELWEAFGCAYFDASAGLRAVREGDSGSAPSAGQYAARRLLASVQGLEQAVGSAWPSFGSFESATWDFGRAASAVAALSEPQRRAALEIIRSAALWRRSGQ